MHLGGGGGGKAATSLPSNLHSAHAWLDSDMLLRFDDPELESRFARHNGEVQAQGEIAWLVLGMLTALFYGLAALARGETLPLLRVAQFQCVPASAVLMWFLRRNAFLRHREVLWFAQRCVVLLATPLPGSFVFTQPAAVPLSAFGLCNLTLEVLTRRLRLHLQLLSSLFTYAATLSLMSLHPEGSVGRSLVTPSYLSLHLALTGVVPVCIAACCDYMTRLSFQSHLAAQQQQQQETLGAAQHQKQPPQKLVAA